MSEGRKFDAGKAEYGLIPPNALHEMVKVLTVGAQKYDRENWKKVPDRKRRYFDALERHIWAWKRGEENDPDDGLHHLAHAACCVFFLYEVDKFYSEGNENGKDEQKQNESMAQSIPGTTSGQGQEVSISISSPEQRESFDVSSLHKSWNYTGLQNPSNNYGYASDPIDRATKFV